MFWEIYLNHKRDNRNTDKQGLMYFDARFACHIAQWEGIMDQALLRGDNETYIKCQNYIRQIFEKHLSTVKIPKELLPGHYPERIAWPETKLL